MINGIMKTAGLIMVLVVGSFAQTEFTQKEKVASVRQHAGGIYFTTTYTSVFNSQGGKHESRVLSSSPEVQKNMLNILLIAKSMDLPVQIEWNTSDLTWDKRVADRWKVPLSIMLSEPI
jgi:hypothetical protein